MNFRAATAPVFLLCLGAAATGKAQSEMPDLSTIETAGASSPFVEAGEGEPVLFVHGAVGDYRKWDGLWRDVAEAHRFMAYTQRWFGTGDWPDDKPYSRDVHSADLVAILRAIGKPVHLVGLSNGGPPALRAAIEVPDLVRSLVLYEANLPEILSGDAEGEKAVEAFFEDFGEVNDAVESNDAAEAARELIESIYAPEGGFETLDPVQKTMVLENAHTVALMWNGPDATPIDCDMLATIKAPTLVIFGAETLPAWRLEAAAIANCIPGATSAAIEGVGHNGPVEAKAIRRTDRS